MKDSSLSAIGKTIKELRKKEGLSLQKLADRSKVTAGLISRIENFRSVPSLPVLQQIAIGLETSMSELVDGVTSSIDEPFIHIKKSAWKDEDRDDSQGMLYQEVFSSSIKADTLKVNMVTLSSKIERTAVENDAHEMIYVLSGKVTYTFPEARVSLSQGDTLYFDGRSPHSLVNPNSSETVLLVVYLLNSNG